MARSGRNNESREYLVDDTRMRIALAEPLDLPAGADAQAVGIEQQGHHHVRLEGGLADAVGLALENVDAGSL